MEAKVTRATLYRRHFAGKEELALACLDQADRGIRAQIAAARASSLSDVGKVQGVAESTPDRAAARADHAAP